MSRIRDSLDGPIRRELLVGGLHLGALWAFAFVQPLLELLEGKPASGDRIVPTRLVVRESAGPAPVAPPAAR